MRSMSNLATLTVCVSPSLYIFLLCSRSLSLSVSLPPSPFLFFIYALLPLPARTVDKWPFLFFFSCRHEGAPMSSLLITLVSRTRCDASCISVLSLPYRSSDVERSQEELGEKKMLI